MEEGKERNGAIGNIQGDSDGYVAGVDNEKLVADGGEPSGDAQREVEPLQLDSHHSGSAHQTSEGLKIIVVSAITFAIGITVALIVTIYCGPPQVPPHGAVACDVPECADIGADILKKGGSAVDAAIAATLCAGVVHPHHSGIGGGAVMVIRNHREKISDVIDGREVAPLDASKDMYSTNPEDQTMGIKSAAVPGELSALAVAHSTHGKLSWKDVVSPAVNLARDGFIVSKAMAQELQNIKPDDENAKFAQLYFPGGTAVTAGTLLKNPDLADTLEIISDEGADSFYNGSIAKAIADELASAKKGGITMEDFEKYQPVVTQPIKTNFLNFTVEASPAPSSGPLLLFLLNYMENTLLSMKRNPNQTEFTNDGEKELMYHMLIEGIRYSHSLNSLIGDPKFNEEMRNLTSSIISKEYAEELANKTDQTKTQNASFYGTAVKGAGRNTAQISVIGPNEDHVSVTTSINRIFGSRYLTNNGVLLNSAMADFDLATVGGSSNEIAPGKRPRSTLTPTVVHSRDRPCGLRLAVGGVHGDGVPASITQMLINLLELHQPLDDAIDAPRIYHSENPEQVEYDVGFPQNVLNSLSQKGHGKLVKVASGISFITAAAKANETVTAHADFRTPGNASVF